MAATSEAPEERLRRLEVENHFLQQVLDAALAHVDHTIGTSRSTKTERALIVATNTHQAFLLIRREAEEGVAAPETLVGRYREEVARVAAEALRAGG